MQRLSGVSAVAAVVTGQFHSHDAAVVCKRLFTCLVAGPPFVGLSLALTLFPGFDGVFRWGRMWLVLFLTTGSSTSKWFTDVHLDWVVCLFAGLIIIFFLFSSLIGVLGYAAVSGW